jgi:hypothetical protein
MTFYIGEFTTGKRKNKKVQPSKKYTLKNRFKPTPQPKFLREYFFLHPRKFCQRLFKKRNLFFPSHWLTANLNRHRIEWKSLLITFVLNGNTIASD